MNYAAWEQVARPIVAGMVAVFEEFGTGSSAGDFEVALYRRYKAAAARRDPEALRAVCEELKREARRQWLAQQHNQKGAA
jgi:hypothetical protein